MLALPFERAYTSSPQFNTQWETAVDESRKETADRVARHRPTINNRKKNVTILLLILIVPPTGAAGSNVVFLCLLFFFLFFFFLSCADPP